MNVALAAESSAATNDTLLASKQIIRNSTLEMSEHRRDLICKLLDDLYQLGFTAGVEYMGKEVLTASRISNNEGSHG